MILPKWDHSRLGKLSHLDLHGGVWVKRESTVAPLDNSDFRSDALSGQYKLRGIQSSLGHNRNDEDHPLAYDDRDYDHCTNEIGGSQILQEEGTDNDVPHMAQDSEFLITDSSTRQSGPPVVAPDLAAFGIPYAPAQWHAASSCSRANPLLGAHQWLPLVHVSNPILLKVAAYDPDNAPRTVTYSLSLSPEPEQRLTVVKKTNSNQILRVENNIVRVEQSTQCMADDIRSSMLYGIRITSARAPEGYHGEIGHENIEHSVAGNNQHRFYGTQSAEAKHCPTPNIFPTRRHYQ
ncbi:uncharacterized protein C8R40DRAFT_1266410 [Lentinula edodes]|uniref:uncharacterized protein n=1 Tax=Lentinula edodes TaxID=5353 RepID=UPI001E8E940C|nr:uncharacterized protein C8R40DRAFT_1266410 [Lentinula edodes]KAH7873087.1 hypothetical protein C8R40DRAFT_1266410 [Lentinula edodes]